MGSDKLVVLTTTSSEDEAKSIATILVNERLAACVSIIPLVRSIYWWEGEVKDDRETMLIVKTDRERFEKLSQKTLEIHSYMNPEIIAIPVEMGNEKYLEWMDSVLSGERE